MGQRHTAAGLWPRTLNKPPSVGTQGGCFAFRDDGIGPAKASRFSVSPKARFLASVYFE